ncbi:YihY/virulence factor BrkB family protein, partial [Mesorhizobium sp. M4B.F.Ca.ET.200.01.1.1]
DGWVQTAPAPQNLVSIRRRPSSSGAVALLAVACVSAVMTAFLLGPRRP